MSSFGSGCANHDDRARSGTAFVCQSTAVLADDGTSDRYAKAVTRIARGKIGCSDPGLHFFGHAAPLIDDGYLNAAALGACEPHLDSATRR